MWMGNFRFVRFQFKKGIKKTKLKSTAHLARTSLSLLLFKVMKSTAFNASLPLTKKNTLPNRITTNFIYSQFFRSHPKVLIFAVISSGTKQFLVWGEGGEQESEIRNLPFQYFSTLHESNLRKTISPTSLLLHIHSILLMCQIDIVIENVFVVSFICVGKK